jgi:hypothetical protein
MDAIKKGCPDEEPSFLKKEDGVWYEVDDAYAREKIGCVFRDQLFTKYRSSTKAKLARKKQQVAMEEERLQKHAPSTTSNVTTTATSSSFKTMGGLDFIPSSSKHSILFATGGRVSLNSANCIDHSSNGDAILPSSGAESDVVANRGSNDNLSMLATLMLGQRPRDQQKQQPLASFSTYASGDAISHAVNQRRDLLDLCPNMIGLPGGNDPVPMEPGTALREAFGLIQNHRQQQQQDPPCQEVRFFDMIQLGINSSNCYVKSSKHTVCTNDTVGEQDGDLPDDISGIFD